MKKLYLIFAVLFISVFGYGQNTIFVNENPVLSSQDADSLGGEAPAFYLSRTNHTDLDSTNDIFGFQDTVTVNTNVSANTTHRTSDGSDHTFIDQDVTNGSAPVFDGSNITGISSDSSWVTADADTLAANNRLTLNGISVDSIIPASSFTGNLGNSTTGADTVFASVIQSNSAVSSVKDSLVTKCECSNVVDDGTIVLPDATTQNLIIWVDGDDEWGLAAIQADGTVTLPVTVGSVVNTDTDTNLCIFDSGTGATIKNRLGSSKVICYETKYKL